ncbi:transporter substrate-binding domain-containing protein [Natronospirillum operosum]|uniref:Transporter substrate-binding domain-containing protein n=1 Tax=Natronospirillum operosum TaxID=2759953 RepID=A0A4Z0WFP5_9GAMM|nr:transporter substrate-binding domain-containing protein [Natronospirillum operosum]TGG94116.1 transporter substrate-binding domain-containing protein [Natronospirillum operosum]
MKRIRPVELLPAGLCRTVLIVLFPALLLITPLSARTLVGAGDPWPPFLDPDLPGNGIAVQIVTAALETQGYDVEWNNMPWARALYGVRDGEYDILVGAWHTDERAEFLLYSEPYIDNDVRIIMRADDDFEFEGIEDLAGKRIGTVLGYGYGDEFNQADNYIPEPAVNLITNIRRLVGRRIDLTVEDELVARYLINDINPDFIDQVRFSETPLMSNSLHVAVGQDHPEARDIIDAFNAGFALIREDGTYEQILRDNNLLE